PPFSPGFGKIRADRSRRAPNLIGQRIRFILGKALGMLKDLHRSVKCLPVNLKITMSLNLAHILSPCLLVSLSPCLLVSLSPCLLVFLTDNAPAKVGLR